MGRPPNHSGRRRRLTKPSRGRDGHGKRGRQNRAGRPGPSLRAKEREKGSGDSKVKAAQPALPDPLAGCVSTTVPLPTQRTRTILLLEGINVLTNRPIRAYLKPDDTFVVVETVSAGDERWSYPPGRFGTERRSGGTV